MKRRHSGDGTNTWRQARGTTLVTRYVPTAFGLTRVKHGGHGAPTAVFVGGIGEGWQAWEEVLASATEFSHVVAYDRLGLGRSAPTPRPRDSRHVAEELRALLDSLPEQRPVVLAAHSAGAFHIRMFAHQWPERVAAMVFAEPSHEGWLPALRESDPSAWLRHMQWRNNPKHSPGRKRELAAWDETISQMRGIGPELPDMPVTIISATAGHSGAANALFETHQRWMESLPQARHVVTDRCGHYLQKDAPDVVVRALEETIDAVHAAANGHGQIK